MANDFFGIQSLMEGLGFRTRPLRTFDDFTTQAAAGTAKNTAAAKTSDAEQLAVKTFDEYLADATRNTREMTLDEFKDYVNEVLASLQAQNAQMQADRSRQEDLSAATLKNQMQLSSLYSNLLQNSLTGTDVLSSLSASLTGDTSLSSLTSAALTSLAGTAVANAGTNAQTILPTASSDASLSALLAVNTLNTTFGA